MKMKKKSTDLNLFKVFMAIYQEQNLTRAAEVLSITQPAVSNALSRLRNSFNDPLFVRSHQGMTPTPFAESIISRVQEAMNLLESSLYINENFDPKVSRRTFSISMNDLSESMVLPKLINAFQKEAPLAKLDCFYVDRQDMEKELSSGKIDVALDVPITNMTTQIESKAMLSQDYVCVVRKKHPLASKKLDMDNYLDLQHAVVSSRRRGLSYEDSVLKRLGHKRKISLRMPYYYVAPVVVQKSDLALTIPRVLAQSFDLKILELPFSLEPLKWNLFWHKNNVSDPAITWLRELILSIKFD